MKRSACARFLSLSPAMSLSVSASFQLAAPPSFPCFLLHIKCFSSAALSPSLADAFACAGRAGSGGSARQGVPLLMQVLCSSSLLCSPHTMHDGRRLPSSRQRAAAGASRCERDLN
eukprot:3392060-Rhodomonas_salina.1